ncbi:helix-turn-helix domain-containing protein [Leptospira sp. GIMC2001]|uniref:helix-turn-helix domain-containing protein n=1 Tax=Leptospira sp. GIMC2001 TaxID=1513297 RepID=UPI002349D0DF|nr:helix-turn-helix domain-containing protein [Leptospira sp. GIMC2001]WCL49530.1 hypothetical protein O4O04_01565 [Leptospira sp. GIMC2001]
MIEKFPPSKNYLDITRNLNSYSKPKIPVMLIGNRGSRIEYLVKQTLETEKIRFIELNCDQFWKKDDILQKFTEAMNIGCLFINSIEKLGKDIQSIINRELTKLKETRQLPWIVSSAHTSIRNLVANKYFIEDLYFRMGVVTLDIIPLGQRKDEIIPIANFYLDEYNKRYKKRLKYFSKELSDFLFQFDYPGELDQMDNLIESLVIIGKGRTLNYKDIPVAIFENAKLYSDRLIPIVPGVTIADYEKEIIKTNLKINNGNRDKTASILNISVRTLYRKIIEYELQDLDLK